MGTHIVHPPKRQRGLTPVLQSTNPVLPIQADTVLGIARLERYFCHFHNHALELTLVLRALPPTHPEDFLSALQDTGTGGTSTAIHVIGSYAYPGIPLLEGCVGSAIRAVKQIREDELDWRDMSGRSRSDLGGVDWSAGQGRIVGRLWRWRWRRRTY